MDDCWWYHSIDLPNLCTVEGQWDLRGRFLDYIGGVDLLGRTVLDVGAASGFISMEAEKHGASKVIGFDAEYASQFQFLPHVAPPDQVMFSKMRNSYWCTHRAFNSKSELVLGEIYKMASCVPQCDVVIVGQILVHLRDPLAALEQAAKACKDTLIITEGSFESDQPIASFLGRRGGGPAWWHLSIPLYKEWLDILGFNLISTKKGFFRCNAMGHNHDSELWTMIARRRA